MGYQILVPYFPHFSGAVGDVTPLGLNMGKRGMEDGRRMKIVCGLKTVFCLANNLHRHSTIRAKDDSKKKMTHIKNTVPVSKNNNITV